MVASTSLVIYSRHVNALDAPPLLRARWIRAITFSVACPGGAYSAVAEPCFAFRTIPLVPLNRSCRPIIVGICVHSTISLTSTDSTARGLYSIFALPATRIFFSEFQRASKESMTS